MSTAAAPPRGMGGSRWSPGPALAVVAGSLVALIAATVALVALVLVFAHVALRDDDGFFTSPTERLQTGTYALTAEELEFGRVEGRAGDWALEELAGRVRVQADAAGGAPVFVGIAREADLDRYLAGVAHDRVRDFDEDPRYARVAGAERPADPAAQDFWVARAGGEGAQVAEWAVQEGRWAAVVMNADGSRGVSADVRVGAKVGWVLWLGLALLAAGAVGLAAGGALVWGGARSAAGAGVPGGGAPGGAPGGWAIPAGGSAVMPGGVAAPERLATEDAVGVTAADRPAHPATLSARVDEPLTPWLWLVKWFLAIPHHVVLAFLWIAFAVVTVVAFVAILATGRYPRALFDFNVGVLRWTWRVGAYATSAITTDRYPPFSLAADPSYPAELEVPYPERLSRGKALVKWWLLALPHYAIVAAFLGGGGWWWFDQGAAPGVLPVLVLVAGVVLLFTGRYPREVFALVIGINRWVLRVVAYAALLRDEYPPFRLDR